MRNNKTKVFKSYEDAKKYIDRQYKMEETMEKVVKAVKIAGIIVVSTVLTLTITDKIMGKGE